MILSFIIIDLLMMKIPAQRDLVRLFANDAHQWQLIGEQLGVNCGGILALPGQELNNLGMIFSRWLSAYRNVTWKAICKMCNDFSMQLGQAKARIAKFLESDDAHEQYGSTDDFDP